MLRRPYVRPEKAPATPLTRKPNYAATSVEVRAVPKGVKAKPGKRAPNAVEERWIRMALDFGCVACYLDAKPSRPAAFHHIVVGNRRLGHLFGFGLCDPGHHQHGAPLGLISRHPNKARFEAEYGKEMDLLALVKRELGVYDKAEYA